MYSKDETLNVVRALKRYHMIANKPNKQNDLFLKDGFLCLMVNGQTIQRLKIDSDDMKQQLEKVEYVKNTFNSSDVKYSPFEADRESAKSYWKQNYNHIDFPKFISVVLFSMLITKKVPDVIDCCNIYLTTYTEIVPDGQAIDRSKYMTNVSKDRLNVGNMVLYTDGRKMKNHVRRFKKEYLQYVKGLPFNEFTTEHSCNRIYKVYGSAVRDIYTVLRLNDFGINTYYSLYDDLGGIDGIIENIPYYGYTKTGAGNDFRNKKLSERHPELDANLGIALRKSVSGNGGVYIVPDKILEKVATAVKNNEVKSMMIIDC